MPADCGARSTGRTTGRRPDCGTLRCGSFAGRITGARGKVPRSPGCAKRALGNSPARRMGCVGWLRAGTGCTVFLNGSVGPARRTGGSAGRGATMGCADRVRAAGSAGRAGTVPRRAPATAGTSLTRSFRDVVDGRLLRKSCICAGVTGWPCCLAITFSRAAKSTGRGGGWCRATTGCANGSRPLNTAGRGVGRRTPMLALPGLTPGRRATSLRASCVRFNFSTAGRTGRASVNTLRGTAVTAPGIRR